LDDVILGFENNGGRQWCSRGGMEIVSDGFVVNLPCPVPRRKKRLKQTCIAFEISKYSKGVEMLV